MSSQPSISAVALSAGEASRGRSLLSIENQSLAVAEIITIANVSPFHRALNEGASRVSTEYFIQVDADMILDPDCVERLSEHTGDHIGVVLGHLRDDLYGRVQAIKLWRTEALRHFGAPDTVSVDTDLIETMYQSGFGAIHALRFDRPNPRHWHTFGEHRPDYTPEYLWQKHLREGRRERHRGRIPSVKYHLNALHVSPHPHAVFARLALAQGFFSDWRGDRQGVTPDDPTWKALADFLERPASSAAVIAWPSLGSRPRSVFKRWHSCGRTMAELGNTATLSEAFDLLQKSRWRSAWLAELAFCRGMVTSLSGAPRQALNLAEDWNLLSSMNPREGEQFDDSGPLRKLARRIRRALGH